MRLLILLLACSLLLVACGDDDEPSSSAAATPTPGTIRSGTPEFKALVKKIDARCKETIKAFNNLEDFPKGLDPERPGNRLEELGRFLERTDPGDEIEKALHADLEEIMFAAADPGVFKEYMDSLSGIIEHEVFRNAAAMNGDERAYFEEKAAAESFYGALAAEAGQLQAPSCALGEPIP